MEERLSQLKDLIFNLFTNCIIVVVLNVLVVLFVYAGFAEIISNVNKERFSVIGVCTPMLGRMLKIDRSNNDFS